MTHNEWNIAVDSKVKSTWNLHTLLPQQLDFFIMLSSLAGIIGTLGQSNYGAGNTFQDCMARYRTANGLKATALDLGWIGDVGIIAENQDYRRGREAAADMIEIYESELHAILDWFCNPDLENPAYDEHVQTLIGLPDADQLRAAGTEPPAAMQTANASEPK